MEDKKITVGSRAFFTDMPDFNPKDIDILILTDNPVGFTHYRQSSAAGKYTITWARKSKEEFIEYAKRDKAVGLEFGKFLVPEFVDEIGLTIEDLKTLYDIYESKIDDKHTYQKLIFAAYIENNAFSLTDEQRKIALEDYLAKRKPVERVEDKVEETNEPKEEE